MLGVTVVELLEVMGGVGSRRQLVAHLGRAAVDRALAAGDVVRTGRRGSYALPAAGAAVVGAARVGGVVSHRTAALRHGWAVLHLPTSPDVIVPKHRRLTAEQARETTLHWADLGPDDVCDGATSESRTLVDCARSLPLPDALAVADSALRGGFDAGRLAAIARDVAGPGAPRVRLVARLASPLAANPFESGLRAIGTQVDGLDLRPQVSVHDPGFLGRPDLVDLRLRIIVEADSFEHHGGRLGLVRDCHRYNAFVVAGWLVLRFAWEDVMFDPEMVREVLAAAAEQRTEVCCPTCRPA